MRAIELMDFASTDEEVTEESYLGFEDDDPTVEVMRSPCVCNGAGCQWDAARGSNVRCTFCGGFGERLIPVPK